MTSGDESETIGEQVRESWLTTLEANAEFDRGWVEAAVEWVLDEGPDDGTVVDVGCGAGGAACAFASRLQAWDDTGRHVVAIDRDPRLLALAQRRAEELDVDDRLRLACGEVGRLPIGQASVGIVWASGVVHHIADQQAALVELAGLLAPGGTLALVEGGLPLRCLPHEVGLGRPGLESRLDEARARWFTDLRAELNGPPLPYGWPEALARAGLADVQTRSFIAESTPPLDDVGREIATQHLRSALTELGDRLTPDDRTTITRLLDPSDPISIPNRTDLVVTAVRTVHTATLPVDSAPG